MSEHAPKDLEDLVADVAEDAAALLPGLVALAHSREPSAADVDALRPVRQGIGRLARVAAPELLAGLEAALTSPVAGRCLAWLEAAQALAALLPEVAVLRGFHTSSPAAHKDLWEHTLIVLERVEARADLRWVALCHDIGKVATRSLDESGGLVFHHHEVLGAHQFRGIGARLGMDAARIERIAFVIEHHARTNQFQADWTDRAVSRLIRECGAHLPLMLAFSRADWTTRRRAKQEAIAAQQDELERRIAKLTAEKVTLPDGLSEALMRVAGDGPGPWLGEARRWVEAEMARAPEGDAATWAERWHAFARGLAEQGPRA